MHKTKIYEKLEAPSLRSINCILAFYKSLRERLLKLL